MLLNEEEAFENAKSRKGVTRVANLSELGGRHRSRRTNGFGSALPLSTGLGNLCHVMEFSPSKIEMRHRRGTIESTMQMTVAKAYTHHPALGYGSLALILRFVAVQHVHLALSSSRTST